MPYTTPHTITVGELVTVDTMNDEWGGNIAFLANPPACRVYNTAAISTSHQVAATLTFNSERYDTDSMHSTSVNTSRLTINTAGLYLVTAQVAFATNATGDRAVDILLNGSTVIATVLERAAGTFDNRIVVSTVYKLAVGDFLTTTAFQSSGGALNVTATGNFSPEFSATWVGRG